MSSNTNIGNTPVNQGYVQLIHTGETGGIDGTLRTLYDGDGTASDLQIASNKVKVSTELYIGSDTLQEYIQDTVGAMLVTNASHTNLSAAYDDAGDGAIDLTASGEVTLTGTQTLTNKTLASPTFTGTANGDNLTLTGDLTVSGDTIFTNSNTVLIGDAILTLNADETGSPTANAGFEVERGTSTNKSFLWNETDDKWTIGSETFVAGTVEGNLTGNVTGNVTGSASLNLLISNNLSDLNNAATARSNLGVDAAGTDNSTDVTLAGSLDYLTLSGQQITRNAIDLTTDVTGTLPAGNGGTGLTSISTLLNSNVTPTSLGLVIGTDVQAQDTLLQDIADFSLSNPSQDGYLIAYSDTEPQLELVAPGISFNGSTANGLLTYGNSTTADVESNLTYGSSVLEVQQQVKVTDGTRDIRLNSNHSSNAVVGTVGSHDFNIMTANTFRMTIDDAGLVGIGTQSPSAKLHVDGSAIFDTDTGNQPFYITRLGATDQALKMYVDDNSAVIESVQDETSSTYGNLVFIADSGSTGAVIDFKHGTATKMRLEAGSGNLGIGTTSPSTITEIKSTIPVLTLTDDQNKSWTSSDGTLGKLSFKTSDTSGIGVHEIGFISLDCNLSSSTTPNGELVFGTAGVNAAATEKMRIDENGNVGIGQTSPSALLHLNEDDNVGAFLVQGGGGGAYIAKFQRDVGGTAYVEIHCGSDDPQIRFTDSGASRQWSIGADSSANSFKISESSSVGTDDRFTIDDSGNVGIGVTTPDSPLHIGNNVATSAGFDGFEDYQILLYDTGTASTSYGMGIRANTFMFNSDNVFEWRSDNTAKMTLDSSGHLDIVDGHLVLPYGEINDAGTDLNIVGTNAVTLQTSAGTALTIPNASTNVGIGVTPSYKLDVSGDIRVSSGSLGVGVNPNATDGRGDFSNDVVAYSTSDKRLKENIKPLENSLDKVLKISGVEFDWKPLTKEEKKTIHGNEGHDVGVIAQEIEKVLPEVVTTRDSGYKAVKYEKIVPLLIEAIKEQQKQIEELKNG